MIMTLYHVVRQYKPDDREVDHIAGPFSSYNQAFDVYRDTDILNGHQLRIVEQIVEVK